MIRSLGAAEREVVATIAVDEQEWRIFSDSRRLGGTLRKAAARWGVEPTRLGGGWEFRVPLRAVRFVGPPSARRVALGKAAGARRKAQRECSGVDQSTPLARPGGKMGCGEGGRRD